MTKFLALLAILCLGLVAAEVNEDILRDQAMYDSGARSKRAACGPTKLTPTTNPACNWCSRTNCFIVSKKRAIADMSSLIRPICPLSCCYRNSWDGLAKASSTDVSDSSIQNMASSLVNKFGKRAADSSFKKPSVDLVFLIDDSGSIDPQQFKVAQEGAATLSNAVCPRKFGTEKGTKQVSVVLFSTTAKTVLTFENSRQGGGYTEHAILNMKQRSGATATADALKHVRSSVLGQAGSRLNDPDTATIVFVITDGKCNDECQNLKTEAKRLRETGPGVQVFAFGIGEADCQELEDIRGSESGEVFGLPDYNFFEKLANAIKDEMANNPNACTA